MSDDIPFNKELDLAPEKAFQRAAEEVGDGDEHCSEHQRRVTR
jgi:hypothetical protein